MKFRLLLISAILLAALCAHAETMYVSNIVKITLRTGPGTDHKILRMLPSGQQVDILSKEGDWSYVRLPEGLEGWLLARFISAEKPSSLILKALEKEHQTLLGEAERLQTENKDLAMENSGLTAELAEVKERLAGVSKEFQTLKKESTDFLSLKSQYEKTNAALEEETRKAQVLHDLLLERNIYLGLSGAGVLLLGFIIGLSTRKNKRRSSLL